MLLQTIGLRKRFGKMEALSNINFEIREGEVHGLVGENGAGKSTLIKILTGVYPVDEGDIIWLSEKANINGPQSSRKMGINVIHQDRHLIPSFNGVENIYLGLEYEKKCLVSINYKKMRTRVERILQEYNISLPVDLPASSMTPPQQTLLEIVRAILTDCRLLILDEPTASLTSKEVDILFALIERCRAAGTAILYVSHRMDEVFKLTDRITVLRNGQLVDTVQTKDINKDQLVGMMSGDFVSYKKEIRRDFGESMLSAEHLCSKDGIVKNVSFNVRSGEILGIFGLGGSGRTELLECVYGLRPSEGEVKLYGDAYEKRSPDLSIKKGISLICEDRRGRALITSLTVKQNTLLSTINKYGKFGVIDETREYRDTNEKINELSIKTQGADQRVDELSGGNQQKVVFAKALMSNPKVILCDEPTQAVDVKTRAEIHRLLKQKASEGLAIVFVSSDLKEVLDISDNVLVIANGRSKEQFENSSITAEEVLSSCYAD